MNKPIIRSPDEIRERVYESLGESPLLIEKVYDAWRIARDQVNKANDLVQKAIKRLNADSSYFFVSLDDSCVKCGTDVTLGASDIAFALNSLNNFLEKGTKVLESKKKMIKSKRGTKRVAGGYPMVRTTVGEKEERVLINGTKETRTCIEYIDGPNGPKTIPKFIVTEIKVEKHNNFEETRKIEEQGVVVTREEEEEQLPTLKIQRPSLEEKDSCETV